MRVYQTIEKCRMGGGKHLVTVLNRGMQAHTGVFPKTRNEAIGGPLDLVWSPRSACCSSSIRPQWQQIQRLLPDRDQTGAGFL